MSMPSVFKPYINSEGRISRLPAKHSRKISLCLELLNLVAWDSEYSEKEINEIFYSVVDDFAFVRRTLVDMGYLERDAYGKTYHRVPQAHQLAG